MTRAFLCRVVETTKVNRDSAPTCAAADVGGTKGVSSSSDSSKPSGKTMVSPTLGNT
jgi:hypothetical protein